MLYTHLFLFLVMVVFAQAWKGRRSILIKPVYMQCSNRKMALAGHTLNGQEIDNDLHPISNFCLVKVKESLGETVGGIFIPDNAKEKATQGIVLATGSGRFHPDTANRMDMVVKVGDNVLYGKYDGSEVEYDGQTHQLIRDDDVLLTYEGKDLDLESAIPTKDNVLIKLPVRERATVAGLVVSTSTDTSDISMRPDYGEVIRVGDGRQAGNRNKMMIQITPGDQVRIRSYAGEEVEIKGTSYLVVKCYDVLAKIS
jgi:chaperonin GroES